MKQKIKNVYYTYLDILGFKQLVENNSIERLSDLYKNIDFVVQSSLSKGQLIFTDDGERKNIKPDLKFTEVNSMIVSDSIMLWTQDDNVWSFLDMLQVVKEVVSKCFQIGIPLRGVFTSGPLLVQVNDLSHEKDGFLIGRTTIAGKTMVDAYLQEEKQQWSGCVLTKQTMDKVFDSVIGQILKEIIDNKLIVKYPVPYKENNDMCINVDEYVINWTFDSISGDIVRKQFAKYNKGSENDSVLVKIENTIKFADYIKKIQSQPSVSKRL